MSDFEDDTSCALRDWLLALRREVKMMKALFAERRLRVRRYGKTARAAYRAAV